MVPASSSMLLPKTSFAHTPEDIMLSLYVHYELDGTVPHVWDWLKSWMTQLSPGFQPLPTDSRP
eukprot:1508627-Amphidinium_carterae.1